MDSNEVDAPHLSMHKLFTDSELAIGTTYAPAILLNSRVGRWVLGNLFVPLGLFLRPLESTAATLVGKSIVVLILVGVQYLVSLIGLAPIPDAKPMFVAWIALTILLGIGFTVPSIVLSHSFDIDLFKAVLRASDLLRSKHIFYLEAVAGCLKSHKDEVNKRIAALTWILSAIWAVALYLTNKVVEQPSQAKDVITAVGMLYIACLFLAAWLQAYKGGVAAVFVLAEATIQKVIVDLKANQTG